MKHRLPLISALAATALAASLPVHEVVLYKSGVGYFVRQGTVAPGESARLDFKAAEMNDVLKSLTVTDASGGKVTGLRYDSSEPLERKLAEFPFKLGDNLSLSGFLDQVKGAAVNLKTGAETISGTVVGARTVAGSEKQPEREQVVIMLPSGELRTLDLSAVSSIQFADASLQLQLKDYLAALSQARAQDRRSVYIDSTDTASRELIAGYTVPMPVWKSSYRLIFNDKGDPTLEGWAIVDNTTGDDWANVRLAVVSGRPVSFISKLYDPKYVQRLIVELAEDNAAGPRVYEGGVVGGMISGSMDGLPSPADSVQSFAKAAPAAPSPTFRQMQAGADKGRVTSDLAVSNQAHELGDLFEYRFSTPVTVKKNESAMLPFLQQSIGGRKLLIYRDGEGVNPMSAAELTNSSGKTLDGGPITVFDGGGYGGEALMETLKAADKRLISYAVDLGTRISTKLDSDEAVVREIHFNRGVLTAKLSAEETKTYAIRNIDPRPKTLIVEQPIRPGYKLVNQKPSETTANTYRFEVKLAAKGDQKFSVAEEHIYVEGMAASNLQPDVLLIYIENKSLPASARLQLQKLLDQKNHIAAVASDIAQTETSLNDAAKDEERARQNIGSLRQVSGQEEQVNKYAAQLAAQETSITGLRDQLGQLRKQRAQLEGELNAMIGRLDF